MKAFIRYLRDLYSGPFQATLVFSFALVAVLTIGMGTWVIFHAIESYLTTTMDERVARDIQLAETFYSLKLREISGIANRLALHPLVIDSVEAASRGESAAIEFIDTEVINKGHGLTMGGNHLIAILDAKGNVLVGRLITEEDKQMLPIKTGNWVDLPLIRHVLEQGVPMASTEVISAQLLAQVGMADQARIELIETVKAAPQLFDPREGSAGLALVGAAPIWDESRLVGAALVFHIFNNDFTLVDQIKDAAQIDTATIFFGDLRISTNVMTAEGTRAVGTRLSKEVGDIVLYGEQEYVGTAFVVNENYITRYEPLRDYTRQVVGILYVGARQASFTRLINDFQQRVVLVAVVTIALTFILATPVSRRITRPLKELRELARTSHQVAAGNLDARAPVTAGGEVGQLAASFNNMLDALQTAQDQVAQSEKLASLGQLAAGVAHELNNPLATILLYSDILLRESHPNDQHRADLETIVREIQRCKTIVASLLDFARQNQVESQEFDLNGLILRIIATEKRHERYLHIEITPDLDPDLPEIQADPAQLEEVFVNLMSNAAESMPQGGRLILRTRPLPTGMVTVEVEDTGEGISSENLAKLFTPFFTTKPVGKGTGLGLAIVYGIIKMHRGQISVRSQVGSGSIFTIQLPIQLPNIKPSFHASPVNGEMIG